MQELDLKAVGARLKTFREDFIGDQASMAKEANMNVKTISFVENGHRAPNQKLLSYLSSKYKLNQDWAMTGKGDRINNETFDDKYVHNLHAKVIGIERELADMKLLMETILEKLK